MYGGVLALANIVTAIHGDTLLVESKLVPMFFVAPNLLKDINHFSLDYSCPNLFNSFWARDSPFAAAFLKYSSASSLQLISMLSQPIPIRS